MENIVPSPLQHLSTTDIIRMAGLATASLGQEYCRAGFVHCTQRHSTHISGIVDVQHRDIRQNGEAKTQVLETRQHCYSVAVNIKAEEAGGTQSKLKPAEIQISCQCQAKKGEENSVKIEARSKSSQTTMLCCHAAALLYQWLTCPAAFIIVPSVSVETDAAAPERKGAEVVEKDAAHTELGAVATKLSSPSTGRQTMSMRFGTIQRGQPGPILLGDLLGILAQLSLSDLRSMAREYEVATNGMSKPQLAEAIMEKLKQPEAVRRVAATLEKHQRQLLAALTLAGGSITDADLRGLFQRFSLGQPSQLHGTLVALQAKALLFRASLNNVAKNGKGGEQNALLDIGWYVPQEVRAALRVSMPITAFNEVTGNQNKPAPIQQLSEPYGLLADLLLIAHALDGYQLNADDEWLEPDITKPIVNSHSSNLHSTDGSLPLPPPADIPSARFLSSLQENVEHSLEFLRFAVRLLRLADFLSKDQDDEGRSSLRIVPDVAQMLLGPTRGETLRNLFELWLSQSSYEELFELQSNGLRLRCRGSSLNVPVLRSGELDAENSEARQTIIALLAQAPLNQWISFSAFVRFFYRLNPFFLQRRSRLFPTPHWWIEQENGRPLRPLQLNDWLQAESLYLERFLCGPLHWWGICDLVTTQAGNLLAFRLTPLANQMLNQSEPTAEVPVQHYDTQSNALKILNTNELLVSCSAQIWQIIEVLEVFTETAGIRQGSLCYRLTPKSLGNALSRGHRVEVLLELLRNSKTNDNPPASLRSQMLAGIEQWVANYGRVRIYTGVSLLETIDSMVMRELSATTSLDDQIVKSIHPTLFVLKKGATERLTEDLKRRGQFPLIHDEEVYGPERS